jgi:vanillate O-demethylase ferredoxin subunit
LRFNGVDVELSCEQGICGACLIPVLAGTPDHRDEVLSEAERAANDQMTICCSRARTAELTLDL